MLAVAVAYAPVARYGFVNFDDPEYVTDNPFVRRGLTWAGISWAFGAFHAANWHPLTWLSLMLDCQLFGLDAGAMHVTSVALHAGAAVLLFLALERMTGEAWPSAMVAALFALHPLRVESVAWISERKDVLSTFVWTATMLAYAHYAERRTWTRYAAVVLTFAAGLLAKPMVVTLPLALLLLDLWPLRRATLAPASARQWIPLLVEKIPLLALAAGVSVLVYRAQVAGGAVTSFSADPLAARVANALVSYASYVGMTLWPRGLAVFYPRPDVLPAARVALAALVLIAITLVTLWRTRREPWLLVGWLWYLGTLVPVIGIIRAGDQAMADRFTYVPSIGLGLMLVWTLRAHLTVPPWRVVLPAAAAVALAACVVTTLLQVGHWRDSQSLFEHALAVTENNALAHTNYGYAVLEHGRADEAMRHFRRAVELRPRYAKAHLNLGFGLGTLGRADDAIAEYREAIRLDPGYAAAHYDLGLELAEAGRLDEAIPEYRETLRLDPAHVKAHNNLALALSRQGNTDEARAHYEAALALDPEMAAVHNNIAVLLERVGRNDEALGHYRRAVELGKDDARAHFNLASVLSGRNQLDEAAAEYREALRLKPDLLEAHLALGEVLLAAGRGREAIAEYRAALAGRPGWAAAEIRLAWALAMGAASTDGAAEAVRLGEAARTHTNGDDPEALRALAAAYGAAGRFADAAEVARRGIALARASDRAPLADDLERHLAAYSAGRPLR